MFSPHGGSINPAKKHHSGSPEGSKPAGHMGGKAPMHGGGDGHHHFEAHGHEGGVSMSHTHPDGHKEDSEHADMNEAGQHMAQAGQDGGAGGEAGMSDAPAMDGGSDMSSAYCK